MFDIIITACLASNPNVCQTVRLPEAFEVETQCIPLAQSKIAAFMNEHPGWLIRKYGCGKSGGKDT